MSIGLSTVPKNTLLDAEAAAAVFDVTPSTLTVWRSTGRYALPYVKVGRKVRCMDCILPQRCERDSRCNLVTRGFIAGRTGGVGGRRKAEVQT